MAPDHTPGPAPAAAGDELLIDYRAGRNGDVVLTARLGEVVLHQDQVALAKAAEHARAGDAGGQGPREEERT